jgi:hypothetical protein
VFKSVQECSKVCESVQECSSLFKSVEKCSRGFNVAASESDESLVVKVFP